MARKPVNVVQNIERNDFQTYKNMIFFCVGVMYSGEYDACDVTLSVYPHRAGLKNMPGHGGNRTYDLWNTSPMLCQLSYAVAQLAELSWQRSEVRFPPWPGIFFKLTRCGHTLRVTSQTSYKKMFSTYKNVSKCKCEPQAGFFYLFYHIFLQTTHKRLIEVATKFLFHKKIILN